MALCVRACVCMYVCMCVYVVCVCVHVYVASSIIWMCAIRSDKCILVGCRDSIGETAVKGTCRQASVSILWRQPKEAVYSNSSISQASSSVPGKLIISTLLLIVNVIC